jgi:hypothetical protein
MSSFRFVRHLQVCLGLCTVLVLSSAATQTQRASADERLRALYTEEWNWRQKEVSGSDQYSAAGVSDPFPKVDPASQQVRLAYWTKALATLDAIPVDQLSG